jgi:hypothetical protein
MANKRRTREQIAEAVELARTLILERRRKSEIKRLLRRHFDGVLSPRSCERFMARAREAILAELGRGKAFLKALSLAGYKQIVADPNTSAHDKINALTRIDKLMGLEERAPLPPLELFLSFLPAAVAEQFRQGLRDHLHRPAEPPAERPPHTNGHSSRLPPDPDLPLFS